MSSAFAPVLFFPINWSEPPQPRPFSICPPLPHFHGMNQHRYVRSVVGLLYMLLAVLVHWDFFPIRYHLNHHYHVTKNYGSHIPIFDWLFDTYQVHSF